MRRLFLFCFLSFGVLLLTSHSAEARSSRINQIPNGSIFGCETCHTSSSGGPRNAFGSALPLNGAGRTGMANWTVAFAMADSDGDGHTNGTELGDPDGDGTPAAGAQVTNPGDAQSFPQVVNRAPVLAAIDAKAVLEGETLSFEVTGSDEDGDTLTYTATGLPSGATFEDATFTWVPGFDVGDAIQQVTFTVTDGSEQAALAVEITVSDVNRSAAFTSIDPDRDRVIGMEGTDVTFTVDGADPDGDGVTYAWTVNDVAEAEMSGTLVLTVPKGSQDETVSVTVTSADGSSDTRSWTISKMLVGDFDGSGDVGFSDFLIFVDQFGKTSGDADFNPAMDLDNDNMVGFNDFLVFAAFFGLTY